MSLWSSAVQPDAAVRLVLFSVLPRDAEPVPPTVSFGELERRITGVLVRLGRRMLLVLEGPRADVEAARWSDQTAAVMPVPIEVALHPIEQRWFDRWSVYHFKECPVALACAQRLAEVGRDDPTSLTARQRLHELLEQAREMTSHPKRVPGEAS